MQTPRAEAESTALVVATESDWIGVLGRELEVAGLDVSRVADPNTALRWLEADTPSLLVLDGSVPRLMLFRLYAALREQPATAETPVIFTRHPDLRAGRDGHDLYLPPDAAPTELAGLVREALGREPSPAPEPPQERVVDAPSVEVFAPARSARSEEPPSRSDERVAAASVTAPRDVDEPVASPVTVVDVEPRVVRSAPLPAPEPPVAAPSVTTVAPGPVSTAWAERPTRRRTVGGFGKVLTAAALALAAVAAALYLLRGAEPAAAPAVIAPSPTAAPAASPTLIPPIVEPVPTVAPAEAPPSPPSASPVSVAASVPTAALGSSAKPQPQQVGGVRGRVLNGRTYQGVAGASVEVAALPAGSPNVSVASDGEGRFERTGLAAGGYLVRAAAPGFRSAEGNVGVFGGSASTINLLLEPE